MPGSDQATPASLGYRAHWAARPVAVLTGFPLFVSVGAGGIGPPTGSSVLERGSTLGLPVSLALFALAVGTSILRFRASPNHRIVGFSLFTFVAVNVAALLYGSFTGVLSGESYAFFVQTLLPILAYFYGTQVFVARGRTLTETYTPLLWGPVIALFLIAGTTLLGGGSPWLELGSAMGPVEIPQILRYVPTVFAGALVGLGYSEYRRARAGILVPLMILMSLLLLAAVHSRTSILVVSFGVFFALVADPRKAVVDKRFKLLALLLLGGLVFATVLPELGEGPVALRRFFGSDEAAQLSSERRYGALVSSLFESFTSPLGRGFAANEGTSLGGTQAAFNRVSNSENQFGDLGLRAGPLSVIAIVVFLVSVLRGSHAAIRSAPNLADSPFMATLWVATAATICGSTLTQQPLTQPFTGLYLWLMLGLLRGWTMGSRDRAHVLTSNRESILTST